MTWHNFLKLFRRIFAHVHVVGRMSKGADCLPAVSSGLILRAQLAAEEERMPANNDREENV